MVTTWSGSKPGLTARSIHKLRINRPAPISSINESATSPTTSTLRVRLPPESEAVRPEPLL